MRRALAAALAALWLLHNDLWLWDAPHRVAAAWGLPAGFLYHLGYCLAAAALMAWAVGRVPSAAAEGPVPEGGAAGEPR